MGFLPKPFSKSTENNNDSRIIYRNDNVARLIRHNNSDNGEKCSFTIVRPQAFECSKQDDMTERKPEDPSNNSILVVLVLLDKQ